MNQGAVAQPVDQFLRVGRTKDVVDGVGFSRLFDPRRNSQQMQVVVAQNGDGTIAKVHDCSTRTQRVRSPVDPVAGKPEEGQAYANELRVSKPGAQRRDDVLSLPAHTDHGEGENMGEEK